MMLWLKNLLDPGWQARQSHVSPDVTSWLPRPGDARPSRMVCFPLRQDEFVLVAPFLPKRDVLEQLKQVGRVGWIVVYDEQQLAAARYLKRHLPIAAILSTAAMSRVHSDCESLGRFPAGYRLGVHSIYGSDGQGVAINYRTVRRTTLFVSHVVQPKASRLWAPTRRLRRSADYHPEQLGDHLAELGRGRSKITVVFDGDQVWDMRSDEWIESCQQSVQAVRAGASK